MRLLIIAALVLAGSAGAADVDEAEERRLRFFHTHTEEELDVVYYRDGDYVPEAVAELKQFMRDHRTGDEHKMDVGTYDILWKLARAVDNPDGVFEVISAYRSKKTNDMLRETRSGVAKRSQHARGTAIDIRLRGTDTMTLWQAAIDLELGGVGLYKNKNFIHVDTARVRRW